MKSLVYYAEAMFAGKPLPKPYENVHDDTEQVIKLFPSVLHFSTLTNKMYYDATISVLKCHKNQII